MKIQTRLALLVFIFIALFAGVVAMQRNIERKRVFLLLEEEKSEKEVLLGKIIKLQGSLTEMLSIDYSFWDDMVKFLETRDMGWAKLNLEESLNTYKISAIWVYKNDFSPVYSVNSIPEVKPEELVLTPEGLSRLFGKSLFCHFFLKTSLGLIEVYGAPIQPTADIERKTPPRGFLLSGRLWDSAYLDGLTKLLGAGIDVHYKPESAEVFTIDPRKGRVSFSKMIPGWDGKSIAHLHVDSQSEYVKSFNKTAAWTAILFVIFSIVILVVLGLSLILWIGNPLSLISIALKKQDAHYLDNLRKAGTEFGEISRLISSFFVQREALRDNEERLKQISENAGEWIWEVDAAGLYTYSNTLVEKILGYKPEEVVGKKHFYDLFVPEKREELKAMAFRGFAGKEPFRGFINSNMHKNGSVVYLETNGTPLIDDTGKLIGYRGADRDVTERKKAEDALREYEERMRVIFETAHEGILVADRESRKFLFFNQRMCQMLGYSVQELQAMAVDDIHPSEALSSVKKQFEKQATREMVLSENTPMKRKDGSIFYADISGAPVIFGGRPYVVGFFRDVTERKRTEDVLRESEEYLSKIINSIGDPLFVKNREHRFMLVNEAFCVLAGRARVEIIGKDDYDFFPKEQVDVFRSQDEKVFETGKEDINEEDITGAGGMRHTIITKKTLYTDNTGHKFIVGIIRDITERKKMEEALAAGEARYKELIDNMSSGVAVYEAQDRGKKFIFKDFNKAAERIDKINREGVLGKDVADIFPGVKDFGLWDVFQRVYRSGKPEFYPAAMYKDSRISSWRENYVYKLPTGEIVAVFDDVTARKEAEDKLILTYGKLRDTQMQLVQTEKMAAVGQLASGVAHEINNPLTGVLNNVQLIKMEIESKKDKFTLGEFRDLLDIVEESALRCKKITQSLLSFSRASKGTFQPIDINALVAQVIVLVEHEIRLGNVVVEKKLQKDLPLISGDIQLLQQVIFNFISNAKWAIEKKPGSSGGTIAIKTWLEQGKGLVCVEVSDNGIGMPKEHLARIFEPFFTTKPIGEGTGLGLSVAYNIIKEHQGTIEVESVVAQGSAFKICFPAVNQGR